jgi:selenocysteine lyase
MFLTVKRACKLQCFLSLGALFVKSPSKETPLYPMLFGGGQERGFRPGTENTGMIAGLGEAAQLVVDNLETYSAHMRKVRFMLGYYNTKFSF